MVYEVFTKILSLLCVLLLIMLSFVLGISFNISKQPSIIDGAKLIVTDFMHQPQAVDFKNVVFYADGSSMHHKVVGNVCGEVFTFKDDVPYRYKRFIVQVAKSRNDDSLFSFPLFDFEGEMISEPDFQKIWAQKCKE